MTSQKTAAVYILPHSKKMEQIEALPSYRQNIARMINRKRTRLLNEGHDPLNVDTMVIAQLNRLIEGTIFTCLHCGEGLNVKEFSQNPLMMTCNDKCSIEAIKKAAHAKMDQFRGEILQLEEGISKEVNQSHEEDTAHGDEVDKIKAPVGEVKGAITSRKKLEIERLGQVIQAISRGTFKLECASRDCEEEVPLPLRLASPHIGFCRGCTIKRAK